MKIKILKIIIIALFIYFKANSQKIENNSEFSNSSIEEIYENQDDNGDDKYEIINQLLWLKENPVDINNSSEMELLKIPFLTQFQVNSVLEYIKKNGPFKSVYELQYVYGFDIDLVLKIMPFIYIGDAKIKYSSKDVVFQIINYLSFNFDSKNFLLFDKDSAFEGNNTKVFTSLKAKNRNFKLGLRFEKDQGEAFFRGSNKYGYDFYSGYLEINNDKFLKKIIIGDYNIKAGQGLTIWSGYSPGKSSHNIEIVRYNSPFNPYEGYNENNFYRGLALVTGIKKFETSFFLSHKKLDAYLDDDSVHGEIITSFINTGLHRNETEINKEKNVSINSGGFRIQYNGNIFQTGLTLADFNFNKYYKPDSNLYNLYSFKGDNLFSMGFDYKILINSFTLYGEFSVNNNNVSYLAGILHEDKSGLILNIFLRNYHPGYCSLFSSPVSEFTSKNNENGLYFSFKIPFEKFVLKGYVDYYKSKWLRYLINSPYNGKDYLLQFDFLNNENLYQYFRLQYEIKKSYEYRSNDIIPYAFDINDYNLRWGMDLKITNNFQIKNSINCKIQKIKNNDKNYGWAGMLCYFLKSNNGKHNISLGSVFYHTRNYKSKLYLYDPSLPFNSFSNVYSGKGVKIFCNYKMKLSKIFSSYIRWSSIIARVNPSNYAEFMISIRL